ncbi:chorismate mutase [Alkalicoccus urumqiensis]|uniref:chorismate mutase n=1 Tax=Alkalicoccus urumqiensis TaxID=1548213 RepID=A0A2P6MKP1_ALKUR|nr:chorismate mutase [Alkalicoccus urumqiensis]PRO66815.1 chorismate mutase [Alkalicoccus urumqiensis]
MIRGIRGATTVPEDDEKAVWQATEELMRKIESENSLQPESISHVIITVTDDLTSTFPARALREMKDYQYVPVMCAQEIPVPGSIRKCIRLMVSAEVHVPQKDVRHVYLNEAEKLRPDLSLTNEG